MTEIEQRQLMETGILLFLRQYRYRLDNINFMDLRNRTKLVNMRNDFYESHIDSIVENIFSCKIDLLELPFDELLRLFYMCTEIARTYGDGFWEDYKHTTVQYSSGPTLCQTTMTGYKHTTVQYSPNLAKLSPWILQNSTNPLDRILGLILSARRGDENNKIIVVNIYDLDAMKTTCKYLKKHPTCKVKAVGKGGITITFRNLVVLEDFIKSNSTDWIKILDDFFDRLSTFVSPAAIASDLLDETAKTSKVLGYISTTLSVVTMVIDGVQAWKDPNFDTVSDVIIDGIGFVKLPGAIISLELAYTKKGAFSLAKLSTWFEKYFVNMVSQFYFGIDIKK